MDSFELLNMYRKVLYCLLLISACLGAFRIVDFFKVFFKKSKLEETDKKARFAIVIPARNESKVIEGLLKSIKKQDYDQNLLDIYVCVREENDPTIEIAKKYDASTTCYLSKTKPDALNYLFKNMIKENKEYDAILIMDADNLIKKNFITEMNKSYQAGYQIGVGFRNNKEWNNGCVSACSALTFLMINSLQNKPNNEINKNMVVSGTGYYISYDLIKSFGGWPFTTLTEDYELSVYSTLNDIKIRYVDTAEFLDEQPTSFKVTMVQRLRWVKGYLQVHKKYKKDLNEIENTQSSTKFQKLKLKIGIWPFVLAIVSVVVYAISLISTALLGSIIELSSKKVFIDALLQLLFIIYAAMVVFSFVIFMLDIKRVKIKPFNLIKACLFNPIFLASYIPIMLKALRVEEVEWTPIVHTINKDDKDE